MCVASGVATSTAEAIAHRLCLPVCSASLLATGLPRGGGPPKFSRWIVVGNPRDPYRRVQSRLPGIARERSTR
eukprot:3567023-Lingulodinium_polyedra.AAC.1